MQADGQMDGRSDFRRHPQTLRYVYKFTHSLGPLHIRFRLINVVSEMHTISRAIEGVRYKHKALVHLLRTKVRCVKPSSLDFCLLVLRKAMNGDTST
jgi:hypothetical protein